MYTFPSPWGGVPNVTTYTYDMLNHLTQVSMPRGSTTQTRTFNYTSGTTVGAVLLSATNPENGKVSYTYDSNMRLATKTDAKGQVFSYSYDIYNRLTQVSAGGNVLRNYVYDTNIDDPSFSQYSAGRLVEVQYPNPGISFQDAGGNNETTTLIDMFSYEPWGQVAGKRLRVKKTTGTKSATGDLNLYYGFNNEGKVTSVAYPIDSNGNAPVLNYTYDSMMRLSGATDQNNNTVVSGVVYNVANELTNINYYNASEARTYNSLFQLKNITVGNALNLTYNYTAGSNNGKIASMTDGINFETVTYQYDSLNRLISAAGNGWTQTQAYDGFGNLVGRTGTGTAQSTTISTPADPTTNRLTSGYGYDANGNLLSVGYIYDPENRVVSANTSGGTVQYMYDAQNKRVWQCGFSGGACAGEGVTMFGADGKQVATYSVGQNGTTVVFSLGEQRAYFGGKLIGKNPAGGFVGLIQDRLGSVGRYYPYGEVRGTPANMMQFGTYTRDAATGNDYADQRYYSSALGRFTTPDRYQAKTGGASDPTSPATWNRYTYAIGDPIGLNDPVGQFSCDPNQGCDPGCDPEDPECNPGPGCPDDDPFNCGPPPPPPIDFSCAITLFSRSVAHTAGLASHTYLQVTMFADDGTQVSQALNDVLEGGPEHPHNFIRHPKANWGNLVGFTESVPPPGNCYRTKYIFPGNYESIYRHCNRF